MVHDNNATITAIRTAVMTPAMRPTEVTFSHSASEDVVPAFTSVSPIVSHLKSNLVLLVCPVLSE